jgi:putative aldouronate transport system permease protein
MIQDRSWGARLGRALNYLAVGTFALLCLVPLLHIVAVSFSDRAAAVGGFVTLWPIRFTTGSYQKVLEAGAFWSGLRITLLRTILGTALMMLVTVLTAYALSRTARELRGRNIFMWLLIFAMLFSGGIIPMFLVLRSLGMLNTIWALVIPGALPIFNVILLTNFFRDIPQELDDAAVVDGASHWQRLWRIYVPLAVPALATLTLFAAVYHWNSWFDGLIYMTRSENYPLQTFLRTVVVQQDTSQVIRDTANFEQFSDRSVRAAQIVVTTLPILFVYPFLQRYFIAGIRLGAVKG